MRELARFFDNPFDDPNVSLDELLAFSTDNLQRMIANNPGAALNTRITATTSALNTVSACSTDDTVKLGLRKAAKQIFRDALPGNIGKIHGTVTGVYGPGAPEMLAIFPEGRTIFTKATDDALGNNLMQLLTALTVKQAQVGAAVVADAGGLLSTWTALYAASELSTGGKTTTQAGKANARLNLQLQLFLNLTALMAMFPRLPEKCPLYMQQSLLEDHPVAPEPPVPPVPPGP